MISELDESIRRLLVTEGGLDPAEVDIRFEIPDREWASSISKPTINCYLYDLRENRQLRSPGLQVDRDPQTSGAILRRGPWRIDLSYLITAWTKAVEDEHRLLWQVLTTLFVNPIIPTELLQGVLIEAELPIPTTVAQPEGALRSPGEFWSALENKLKPSLNYIVTLPLNPEAMTRAPLVRSPLQIRPPSYLGGAAASTRPGSGGATDAAAYAITATGNHDGHGAGQLSPDRPAASAHVQGVIRDGEGKIITNARVFFTSSRLSLDPADALPPPTPPAASPPPASGGRRRRITGGGVTVGQSDGSQQPSAGGQQTRWGGVHTNRERGTRSSITDCEGQYLFPALPFGRYRVAIQVPGQPIVEREIVVPADSYDLPFSSEPTPPATNKSA